MLNDIFREVFKYIFNNVDLKTKKHMLDYVFEFIKPDTVDNLIGKSIEIKKDMYTGQLVTVDHYNSYEFIKWFFEQPSNDWDLIIDKISEYFPESIYSDTVTDVLCYYSSDKEVIDKMLNEIKSITNDIVDNRIAQQ